MALTLSFCTFLSTFIGGMFGVKYKNKIHLILGFTAGVVLSVVAFDVMPEIMSLTAKTHTAPINSMITLVIGFLVFHILEKTILIHHSHEEAYTEHKHPSVGVISALALSAHSFLDGVGIGLSFQISSSVGVIVAIAVISHDFADGLNTVSLMIANNNTDKKAIQLLTLDAVAPILGVISTYFFTLSDNFLLLYLGFFGGFLLYISTSDILPEAHMGKSSYKTIAMTILGVVFIFIVNKIIG